MMTSPAADSGNMTATSVECLRCGKRHRVVRASHSTIDQGECPRCGYVGWTPVQTREPMRQLPQPAPTRLHSVG